MPRETGENFPGDHGDDETKLFGEKSLESERIKKIQDSQDFAGLYEALIAMGSNIWTPKRSYSSQEIITRIREVREGKSSIEAITRTYGIRDKVKELLERD